MHEQGMMQQHETLMTEMWEKLNDDQKKTMMKRMIDGKIMMKEGNDQAFPVQDRNYENDEKNAG